MFGKIFESMYDGTIVQDWRALITLQQMIVLCDSEGNIDMTPYAISNRTGIPIEHIKAGIEILENPDPYSRSPEESGRRIMRLDDHRPWGWYLVNHKKYKDLQSAEEVREKNRQRKRRQREKSRNAASIPCDGHAVSRDVTPCPSKSRHTDTDTDKQIDTSEPTVADDSRITKKHHEAVIEIYHDSLPELSKVMVSRWHGSKHAKNLGARWREDKRFRTRDFWTAFFQTVRENPWWMGEPDPKSGASWDGCNLAWLVKRENFDKVIDRGMGGRS